MTNNTSRRLTARQLAKALAEIDAKVAGVCLILDTYASTFGEDYSSLDRYVIDAWNAAHDARRALLAERAGLVANPRLIPAAEYGTYLLAAQNID